MQRLFTAVAVFVAILTGAGAAIAGPLDDLAPDYTKLQLEIGAHEEGYIDAYYGPAAWKTEAEARKRTTASIRADVDALAAKVKAMDKAALSGPQRKRRDFLAAHLTSARARLDMIEGKRLPFRDEAELILGWRPDLKPLSHYDPILARLDKAIPGDGALNARVDAFKARYVVPRDRLEPVMRAAIAECRRRTAAHIDLPEKESFTLEFVSNKSWSGYNWYKGDGASLIQINTDLPFYIERAVDLGCHEGYPGHHLHNLSLERKLVRARGWPEQSVYPLYSPTAFISEGTGNYGIELAFPGDERDRYEAEVLAPMAGLDPKSIKANTELREALAALTNARSTISADYLDGKIDRETAIELMRKYQLVTRQRAEQLIKFTDEYRSYVINYGLGQDAVKAYIERTSPTVEGRWKAFEGLISEPSLPAELR